MLLFQFLGIVAGCTVFFVTIVVVFILMIKSGTLARFIDEMKTGQIKSSANSNIHSILTNKKNYEEIPQLYDSLITASLTLPRQLRPPTLNNTNNIIIRTLQLGDAVTLASASNGSALFSGSAYDPAIIWRWLDLEQIQYESMPGMNEVETKGGSEEIFRSLFLAAGTSDATFTTLTILDSEFKVAIGMVQLLNNNPKNLTIEIGNIWITPSRQGEKLAHEAVLLCLSWLFSQGYRRISALIDNRNIQGKRFFERCGFSLEALMLKHRVVNKRNRDTALYRLLNHDWDNGIKLCKHLGISHNLLEINSGHIVLEGAVSIAGTETNESDDDNNSQE